MKTELYFIEIQSNTTASNKLQKAVQEWIQPLHYKLTDDIEAIRQQISEGLAILHAEQPRCTPIHLGRIISISDDLQKRFPTTIHLTVRGFVINVCFHLVGGIKITKREDWEILEKYIEILKRQSLEMQNYAFLDTDQREALTKWQGMIEGFQTFLSGDKPKE
ncbi:MAG: hypothetical protein SF052_15805 [Bacteroidia bacterium]|nr:hypothetical protein [Bacteroidia bacterium]